MCGRRVLSQEHERPHEPGQGRRGLEDLQSDDLTLRSRGVLSARGWWELLLLRVGGLVWHMCVYGIYVYICVWTATWVMDSYVGDGQLRGRWTATWVMDSYVGGGGMEYTYICVYIYIWNIYVYIYIYIYVRVYMNYILHVCGIYVYIYL